MSLRWARCCWQKRPDSRFYPLRSPRDIGKQNEAGTDFRCLYPLLQRVSISHLPSTLLPILTTKDSRRNATSCKQLSIQLMRKRKPRINADYTNLKKPD